MKVTHIEPVKRWRVIVQGPLEDAATAAGTRTNTPLRDTAVNGYGAIHATLSIDREALDAWFAECHDVRKPGTLLFYYRNED